MPSPWRAKERRLKIQAGISWSFVGLGVLSTVPVFIAIAGCNAQAAAGEIGCFEFPLPPIALPISAIVTVASLIPASIYTARLRTLRRRRPESARLQPAIGGLGVRF